MINTEPDPFITDNVLKPTSDLVNPTIGTVAGGKAKDAKNPSNPLTSPYAIIELEIINYDRNAPPIIKIFDEKSNQLSDMVTFAPLTTTIEPPINLKVPLCLVYDKTPFDNPNKEPEARISRIELHMPALNYSESAYVKLYDVKHKWGIFVVPVYWHNVAESGNNSYVNNQHVIDLFWTPPTGKHYNDVNSIWTQAGIQFRLLNTSVPFRLVDIPTHVLEPPHKSYAEDCLKPKWMKNLDHPEAADIFTVYDLIDNTASVHGIGNCRNYGYILIRANDPNLSNPGFTDKYYTPEGRACLIAHEFGHFLGYLPHETSHFDNLMLPGANGSKLKDYQVKLVRDRLKKYGYHLKSTI